MTNREKIIAAELMDRGYEVYSRYSSGAQYAMVAARQGYLYPVSTGDVTRFPALEGIA
jgi:hypothetical protein